MDSIVACSTGIYAIISGKLYLPGTIIFSLVNCHVLYLFTKYELFQPTDRTAILLLHFTFMCGIKMIFDLRYGALSPKWTISKVEYLLLYGQGKHEGLCSGVTTEPDQRGKLEV